MGGKTRELRNGHGQQQQQGSGRKGGGKGKGEKDGAARARGDDSHRRWIRSRTLAPLPPTSASSRDTVHLLAADAQKSPSEPAGQELGIASDVSDEPTEIRGIGGGTIWPEGREGRFGWLQLSCISKQQLRVGVCVASAALQPRKLACRSGQG